ncbi:hypothetical protein AB4Y85_14155 [Microvirga sp. 2YAF29]|uniref:hypothetical protein n=1 Tax=Microvirga sp. 2YAF29 TaxID=3233031 RepID=UPI003F9E2A9B
MARGRRSLSENPLSPDTKAEEAENEKKNIEEGSTLKFLRQPVGSLPEFLREARCR